MPYETLLETQVYEQQTSPQPPHSRHHSRLVLVRRCLGETFCVRNINTSQEDDESHTLDYEEESRGTLWLCNCAWSSAR